MTRSGPSRSTESVHRVVRDGRTDGLTHVLVAERVNPSYLDVRARTKSHRVEFIEQLTKEN